MPDQGEPQPGATPPEASGDATQAAQVRTELAGIASETTLTPTQIAKNEVISHFSKHLAEVKEVLKDPRPEMHGQGADFAIAQDEAFIKYAEEGRFFDPVSVSGTYDGEPREKTGLSLYELFKRRVDYYTKKEAEIGKDDPELAEEARRKREESKKIAEAIKKLKPTAADSTIQPTNPEGWQTVDTSVGTEAVDEPLPPVAWNTDKYHKSYESDISQPAPEQLDRDILESIAGSVGKSAETRLTGVDGELLNTEATNAALKSLELERDEKVERLLLEAASGGNITKEAAMTALLLDALLKQLVEARLDYAKDTIKINIPSIRENPLRRLGRNLKQGLIDAAILLQNKRTLRQTIDSKPTEKDPEPTPSPLEPTQG